MTNWLYGPLWDVAPDLWASLDSAFAAWPPRTAVVVDPAEGLALSPADLRERVELAAGALVAAGALPGERVVLDIERSVDEIVFVLACVRQGVVYVGARAGAPVGARSAWCQDADPVLVVTRRPEAWPGIHTIDPRGGHRTGVTPEPAPSAVCYLSYTSGTSGEPKGVEAPCEGVDRLMRGADYCALSSGDRILRFAPLAFDASTFEIFVGLWRRATIVIGPVGPLDLDALASFLREQKIDVCWLTAGLFSAMVERRPDAFGELVQVLTGGDRVSAAAVTELLKRFPKLSVVNGYGPTEATTFATVRVLSETDLGLESVPIGRPIAGTDVGVSDDGEILIAGRGLAAGYRNDPELTNRRFVEEDGRRVYRTGDLGVLIDGELHFRGRLDRQLKIRGVRVEPSAVDEWFRRERLVVDSWTFGRPSRAGTALVCAFVPRPGTADPVTTLRSSLAESGIPDQAIPHRFIAVTAIPLTPNGKVDEAALVEELAQETAPVVRPSNDLDPTELVPRVREAWVVALGLSGFDDQSGFFDAGGDSLSLAALHAVLDDMFPDLEVKLVDLLLYPSVTAQAAWLSRRLMEVEPPLE